MYKTRQRGVTLMELMIVVVIVGILASIAYPSYREYARRANRAEGKIAVEQRAQALEKCYTRYMAYNHANCAALLAASTTPKGHYSVSAAAPDAVSFTVTAAPQGGQTSDTACGSLTLTQAGTRGETGTGTVQDCW